MKHDLPDLLFSSILASRRWSLSDNLRELADLVLKDEGRGRIAGEPVAELLPDAKSAHSRRPYAER